MTSDKPQMKLQRYNYIIVRPKAGWATLICRTHQTPREMSTICPGSEHGGEEELLGDDAPD